MWVKPITLPGESVILEPIKEHHLNGIWYVGQEAEDWQYMPRPCFDSLLDVQSWIAEAKLLAENGSQITFVIRQANTTNILGSTRFMNIREPHRGLEIGYTWLGRNYQRSAVNTEVKYLMLSYAFEQLEALRVEFKMDLRNVKSQRAIEKLGAKREGVFRRHMLEKAGYIRDTMYYSLIDLEWPKIKKALQQKLNYQTSV